MSSCSLVGPQYAICIHTHCACISVLYVHVHVCACVCMCVSECVCAMSARSCDRCDEVVVMIWRVW